MDVTAPCPAPFNLAAYVLAAGAETREKTALSVLSADTTETWSFARLIAAVRGTGTGLLRAGLVPGDRVLLRLGNTPDFPIAYLGALAVGMVPVPTSTALTETETARIMRQIAPKAMLHDPQVTCPDGPRVPLAQLRAWQDAPAAAWHMGDPDRLGYIIYTSGTSGRPTAVMHAHRAIWARRLMFEGWYGLRQNDRVLHAGAFNWTYTLGTGLMDPWTKGATALIPAPGTPSRDLPALITKHQVTLFAAAPGVYRQMLRAVPGQSFDHLRHGLSAGEKMTEEVRNAWIAATGTPVYEAFGMSECSTFISGSPETPATAGAIGRAQPGRKVAILDNAGQAVVNAPGQIAIDRFDPGLALGYFGAEDAFAEKVQGAWFVTGDQGIENADGQITYLGRADDMMNAGGFRVSPLEVEHALLAVPTITGVGAAEVTVKEGTTVIAAFYTAREPLDDQELKDHAAQTLADYKQPRVYMHLESLPVSSNGKLSRRALRRLYEAQNDRSDQT